jgi:hypothetical protein
MDLKLDLSPPKDGNQIEGSIWGSHGGEYEDGCILGCSAV